MASVESEAAGVQVALRERMPGYVASFGVGLAVTVVIGLVVWIATDVPLATSVANTIFFYGIALFFAGGIAGGGYTKISLGATRAIGDSRRSDYARDDVGMTPSGSLPTEADEHMPRIRRPEAKPGAFWQVMGGGIYVAIGLFIVIMWS